MIQAKRLKPTAHGRLIGYACVSTEEQGTDPQLNELHRAGCAEVLEEHASGADRTRPVSCAGSAAARHQAGRHPGRGPARPAGRSVSHLLAVIEQLEAVGAHFRSLSDPIDTTTPQRMFSLQVLGAIAQLERALIAERTKSGLQAARARGRVGGNPGLRAGNPDVIRQLRASRDAVRLGRVLNTLDTWLPTVRRMRPTQPWGDCTQQRHLGMLLAGKTAARSSGPPGRSGMAEKAWRRLLTGTRQPNLSPAPPPTAASDGQNRA